MVAKTFPKPASGINLSLADHSTGSAMKPDPWRSPKETILSDVEIVLNGELRQIPAELRVSGLLVELNLQPKYLAVELNEKVLPRSQFDSVRLQSGDRVEIVTLVGGG